MTAEARAQRGPQRTKVKVESLAGGRAVEVRAMPRKRRPGGTPVEATVFRTSTLHNSPDPRTAPRVEGVPAW
jgi:hypothetical protein